MGKAKKNLAERVTEAAERCLDADRAVGIIEVFQRIGFLEPVHFESWKKGMEYYPILDDCIQCGEVKKRKTIEHFLSWVRQRDLEPFEVSYEKTGRHGSTPLRLTKDDDEATLSLYRTKFRPQGMTEAQKQRVEKKANKPADLLVYMPTGKASECAECQASLEHEMLFLESGKALCLRCADMDHLCFLPSGNATLTRRAKKNSPLSAVVLKFDRRRKRYERQGILATEDAIDDAEASLEADADQRAKQREKAAERRKDFDQKLVTEMAQLILADFPGCPNEEAQRIAAHTAMRGSGRVGRSAAGRALSPEAIELAVRAWIRHQHTEYDSLLMRGVERMDVREQIAADLKTKRNEWLSK